MGPLLLLFLSFFSPALTVIITGTGGPVFWPFLRSAAKAYKLINPSFTINYETVANGAIAISRMATGNTSIDFGLIDSFQPTPAQYQVGLQAFPYLTNALVAQINLANGQDIILPRPVLADIFMGVVKNWNDSAITSSNPGVVFPNASIQVYFRADVNSGNTFFTTALSSFSATWNSTYGISSVFPPTLQNTSNFSPFTAAIPLNGGIAARVNTIGYGPYYLVARDPSLHYVQLKHKYTGQPIPCNGDTLEAAGQGITFGPSLIANYSIDQPDPQAWPIGNFIYLLVSTNPTDCENAREFYKFIRWAMTNRIPQDGLRSGGVAPLTLNTTDTVIKIIGQIKCDGKAIGTYEDVSTSGWEEIFFFILANLVWITGIVLSGVHIYHFSTSHINFIYSIIFIIGTTLTLISPIFWFFRPNEDGLCAARIWTGSNGFAILLGTMFSRTWQLNDIYSLQKAKRSMDALRYKLTTNKTITQLAMALSGVVSINFLILLIWSSVDPLRRKFVIVDPVALTGYNTCSSDHIAVWLLLQLFFFLSLLCFGVYVIYKTWSFQRQASLVETRWVLVALYNVILNLCAVVPILAFIDVTERVLALVVIISIDLSGGSIVCAVLLPRLVQKLEASKSDPGGSSGKRIDGSVRSPIGSGNTRGKQKVEISRTPEEELAKRLEEPLPLLRVGQNLIIDKDGQVKTDDTQENIELASIGRRRGSTDISHTSTDGPSSPSHLIDRSPHGTFDRHGMAILEEQAPDDEEKSSSSSSEEKGIVKGSSAKSLPNSTTPRLSGFPRTILQTKDQEQGTEIELLKPLDESSSGY